ncbi:MAG: DNA cytosine methyltransferase [Lachnospiraceae bacterium]|nr:DNA cytosine methyltransferase [Lachnospiraceae bacterium]
MKIKHAGTLGKDGNCHNGYLVLQTDSVSTTLLSRDYKDPIKIIEEKMPRPKINQIGNLLTAGANRRKFENPQPGRVIATDGSSPALDTCSGGGHQPKIMTPAMTTEADYRIRKLTPLECWRLMGFSDEDFHKAKWMVGKEAEEYLKKHPGHKKKRKQFEKHGRIERTSDTQLYKQAGNSIVLNVMVEIFKPLVAGREETENV